MKSNLRQLLNHFNGQLEQGKMGSDTKNVTVDREKLCDLLSEIEAMLAVEAAKSR